MEFCCKLLSQSIKNSKIAIKYLPTTRSFYIYVKSGALQEIYFCPFCSAKLPEDLSDQYYSILENKYHLYSNEDLEEAWTNGKLPDEFKTDKWWKKKGL
jgi:hypothetical protein